MADESVTQALLSQCEVQIANYREYRQRSGADFNVFKIVNRATDEVHGHSAFIAELLNPTGSHGQGRVFLDLFFEVLGIQKDVEGIDHWQVAVEASRDVDGRIDILLTGQGNNGRRLGIAIENKIYASDQEHQLKRYWDYLNNTYGSYQEGVKQTPYLLYYLTLDGSVPTEQSVSGESGAPGIPNQELSYLNGSPTEAPVRLISYEYHIVEWLKECHGLLAVYPYAREVLAQYLDTVNTLTGNGGGMTENVLSLLDTSEKLYAAAQLSNAVTLFKQSLVCELWEMIQKEWGVRASDNASVLEGSLEANRHLGDIAKLKTVSRERFSKSRNVPRWFGLVAKVGEFSNEPIGVEIRFDNCFYVGLYGVSEEKVLEQSTVKNFYHSLGLPNDLLKDCKAGTVTESDSKERIYITTPFNFDNDNQKLFCLVDSEQKKKLVDTIFEIAENLVKEIKRHGLKT